MLKEKYKKCLDRDPYFGECIDKTLAVYFKEKRPTGGGMGGMMGGGIGNDLCSSSHLLSTTQSRYPHSWLDLFWDIFLLKVEHNYRREMIKHVESVFMFWSRDE